MHTHSYNVHRQRARSRVRLSLGPAFMYSHLCCLTERPKRALKVFGWFRASWDDRERSVGVWVSCLNRTNTHAPACNTERAHKAQVKHCMWCGVHYTQLQRFLMPGSKAGWLAAAVCMTNTQWLHVLSSVWAGGSHGWRASRRRN